LAWAPQGSCRGLSCPARAPTLRQEEGGPRGRPRVKTTVQECPGAEQAACPSERRRCSSTHPCCYWPALRTSKYPSVARGLPERPMHAPSKYPPQPLPLLPGAESPGPCLVGLLHLHAGSQPGTSQRLATNYPPSATDWQHTLPSICQRQARNFPVDPSPPLPPSAPQPPSSLQRVPWQEGSDMLCPICTQARVPPGPLAACPPSLAHKVSHGCPYQAQLSFFAL